MESIGLLRKMVEIDSTYPNEAKLSKFLFDYLSRKGFKAERVDAGGGRFSILAEIGRGEKQLLFLTHMDTVRNVSAWSRDPFKLTEEGDRLYGLGALDMKGGIAAILEAAQSSKNGRAKILICVDEENISKGAWTAVKKRRDWFRGVRLVVSAEPPIYEGKGHGNDAATVTVGRGGRIVIHIDVKGRAAHQGSSTAGINAIEEAARIAARLGEIKLENHSKLGKEQIFARKIAGEAAGLSVPENASLELDMRLVPPSNETAARKKVEAFVNKLKKDGILSMETKTAVKIKERETPYLQPYQTNLGDKSVKKALEIIKSQIGKPVIIYGRSVSDENVMAKSLSAPVIRIGPRGGGAHAGDEWVSRSGLAEVTKFYRKLIESYKY